MSEPVMDQVHESKDNEVVYEQLREAYKVLETKQIKQVNDWINSLVRMDHIVRDPHKDHPIANKFHYLQDSSEKEPYIKQLIQAKNDTTEAIRKVKLLGIELLPDRPHHSSDNGDDNDDHIDDDYLDELFEDVELPELDSEAPLEHTITSTNLPPAHRLFPLSYEPSMTEDATYSGGRVQQADATTLDNDDHRR